MVYLPPGIPLSQLTWPVLTACDRDQGIAYGRSPTQCRARTKTDAQRFVAIPAIGLFDGLADGKIRLSAFFLIPIMLITWRMGRAPGYLATLASLVLLWIVSFVDKPHGTNLLFFMIDAVGRFIAFFIIVAILSRSRELYLKQKTIATRDSLTNLYNRLGLQEILDVEMENSRRYR
jgi:glucose-6-phosphate-specific signal transduction histidine kinase